LRGSAIFADGTGEVEAIDCLFEAGADPGSALVYVREATCARFDACTLVSHAASPFSAHGSTTRQPRIEVARSVVDAGPHPLVSGSQGIYRASFDATESLLSVFPDESIVGRAEQCKAGTPVFDSTHGPRGGLVDSTIPWGARRRVRPG